MTRSKENPFTDIARQHTVAVADLTMYGPQELSLVVLNTEYLYRRFRRCEDEQELRDMVREFRYTEEQFEELCSDLVDDLEERDEK